MDLIQRPTERVKITLSDGVERTLRYPLSALKAAREEFGFSIAKLDELAKLDETTLGKLIWYGLKADDPSITVEQVEGIIEPPMLPYIFQQYFTAIGMSLPEPKNAPAPGAATTIPTPMEKSTGSIFGASGAQTMVDSGSLATSSGL